MTFNTWLGKERGPSLSIYPPPPELSETKTTAAAAAAAADHKKTLPISRPPPQLSFSFFFAEKKTWVYSEATQQATSASSAFEKITKVCDLTLFRESIGYTVHSTFC